MNYKKNLSPMYAVATPNKTEVLKLDSLFMRDGLIVPVSAKAVRDIPINTLRAYCHYRAIYGIITHEIVEWTRKQIGGRKAIEIGSGNGTLGTALKIPCTDNCMQRDDRNTIMMYKITGQPTIKYPSKVEKLDAIQAVKKYKPTVVVASWVTHKYDEKNHEIGGNMLGVDENLMMSLGVQEYIMFGNEKSHWGKPIFNNPKIKCQRIINSNYISRSLHREDDYIYRFTHHGR